MAWNFCNHQNPIILCTYISGGIAPPAVTSAASSTGHTKKHLPPASLHHILHSDLSDFSTLGDQAAKNKKQIPGFIPPNESLAESVQCSKATAESQRSIEQEVPSSVNLPATLDSRSWKPWQNKSCRPWNYTPPRRTTSNLKNHLIEKENQWKSSSGGSMLIFQSVYHLNGQNDKRKNNSKAGGTCNASGSHWMTERFSRTCRYHVEIQTLD